MHTLTFLNGSRSSKNKSFIEGIQSSFSLAGCKAKVVKKSSGTERGALAACSYLPSDSSSSFSSPFSHWSRPKADMVKKVKKVLVKSLSRQPLDGGFGEAMEEEDDDDDDNSNHDTYFEADGDVAMVTMDLNDDDWQSPDANPNNMDVDDDEMPPGASCPPSLPLPSPPPPCFQFTFRCPPPPFYASAWNS